MNTTYLRYFIAVYEEGNVTRAAEKCAISQPSVSSAIKALEEELNVCLFLRTKKGVELTDEAHHLYPLASRIVNSLDALPNRFRKERECLPLSLGVFPDLSPSNLAKTLETIRNECPCLKMSLSNCREENDANVTIDVIKYEKDVFLPLWEEDYLLCMRPDHPLASKTKGIYPQDLNNFSFVECPPCEAHQRTIGLIACDGDGLEISARAEEKSHVLQLVRAGYGISFLPSGLLEKATDLVVLPFHGPRMYRQLGLAYTASQTLNPVLMELVQALSKLSPNGKPNA